MKPLKLVARKVYDAPEGPVTLAQLRDFLNQQPPEALTAPALFSHLDIYGTETLLPVEIILDTWHPADTPRTVYYSPGSEEYSRMDDDGRPLGQLPPGCPLLHFDAMEENALAPRNKWLKKHLRQPAPPAHSHGAVGQFPDLFSEAP